VTDIPINKKDQSKYLHWALFAIGVIVFIFFKWSYLSLPFYWDEAWSYIPAVKAMAETTPSLLPNTIDPELYRGHPTFFYFLSGLWAKIFGFSNQSLHGFALVISCLTLASFRQLTSYLFNDYTANILCLILGAQIAFFVQSTFVLPEIMLALFTILGLLFYYKQKWLWFILSATALGWTKETGLLVVAGFYGIYLYEILINKRASELKKHLYLLLPIILTGAFYFIQKLILGWFFFPDHIGILDKDWNVINAKLEAISRFIFVEQGRKYFLLLFAIGTLFQLLKRSKNKWTNRFQSISIWPPLSIIFLVLLGFTVFNFMSARYSLLLFPMLLIIGTDLSSALFMGKSKWFVCLFTFIALFVGWNFELKHPQAGDCSYAYQDVVKSQQEITHFLEDNAKLDDQINAPFLMYVNLTNPACGHLKNNRGFNRVKNIHNNCKSFDYVVFSSVEYNEGLEMLTRDECGYKMIKESKVGIAWHRLYKKQIESIGIDKE